MRRALAGLLAAITTAGCFSFDHDSRSLTPKQPVQSGQVPVVSPASTAAAARVDLVGRRVLAANPQVGARPVFRTVGSPATEVFFRGTSDIFITEGLVQKCETDGQLAAVLCQELGQMVAAREAMTPATTRRPNRPPPMDLRLGGDDRFGGSADRTEVREISKFDGDRAPGGAVPLPDANHLARDYHARAGYTPRDFDAAEPVLKAASRQGALRQQVLAGDLRQGN